MKAMILLITLSNSAEFSQSGIVVQDQSRCGEKGKKEKTRHKVNVKALLRIERKLKCLDNELMIIRSGLMRCK